MSISSMDLPTIHVDLGPEKIEEEKEGGPLFHCDLCDTEVVHKLAQMFLPGLASACVDNTSGDLFKSPGSVAVDFRKEMIQYLIQRSESFVAESIILEGGGPDGEELDHPFDIVSNFVDDFATSKRNLFTRVSEWALSEKREDKIDDFIQELEMNGFWTLDRREAIAQTLLKNVDFKDSFHCTKTFHSSRDLDNHVHTCNFRPMICQNQGCNARFCASHLNDHESICPFKIIPCEQRCSASIMRRDMDRHCITVCPMKLVNCPFYAVGCRSAVAQCLIEKHCLDDVQSHLWHLLKGIHKQASGEVLKQRVEQIVQASSSSHLSRARDVRSLNFIVKDVEAKLGPLEVGIVQKTSAETVHKNNDREDSDTNVTNTNGIEETTQASHMVDSSDKAGVSVIVSMHTAENTGNGDESKHSDTENKFSEERIQSSNIPNLPDKDKIDLVNGSEETTQASHMVDSSDKAGVSVIVSTHTAESDESKHSDTENKFSEERIQSSNIPNLPDKDKIDLVNGSEETTQASHMVDSSDKAGVSVIVSTHTAESDESKHSDTENKFSEERIQSSNIPNLPDKDKIDLVNGSEETTQASHMVDSSDKAGVSVIVSTHTAENTGNGDESEHSDTENKFNEERIQSSNIPKLLDKDKIDLVNEGNTHINKEDKDAAAGDLKFKEKEEATRTDVEISAEKINATNEDSAQNGIISRHIEDGNLEDKDKVQSIQNLEAIAENDVKNKDTEDDNLKERMQTLAV